MSPKTPPPPPNKDDLTFEEAMHRLEALVESLDGDGSTLDEALAAYEEGVHLAQYCLKRLDTAELRVQQLGLEDAE